MNGLIHSSLYFGMLVSVGAYMLGVWLKKKTGWAILNPLLVAIIVVIAFLSVFHIEYKEYNRGAVYLSYFLTPATVCLAIPLYKQLELLRQHLIAVVSAIVAGGVGNMIDRLRFDYVVDFISFVLIHFPIFNVADCYVTIAAVLLIYALIFRYKDEFEKED